VKICVLYILVTNKLLLRVLIIPQRGIIKNKKRMFVPRVKNINKTRVRFCFLVQTK